MNPSAASSGVFQLIFGRSDTDSRARPRTAQQASTGHSINYGGGGGGLIEMACQLSATDLRQNCALWFIT